MAVPFWSRCTVDEAFYVHTLLVRQRPAFERQARELSTLLDTRYADMGLRRRRLGDQFEQYFESMYTEAMLQLELIIEAYNARVGRAIDEGDLPPPRGGDGGSGSGSGSDGTGEGGGVDASASSVGGRIEGTSGNQSSGSETGGQESQVVEHTPSSLGAGYQYYPSTVMHVGADEMINEMEPKWETSWDSGLAWVGASDVSLASSLALSG